MTDRLTDSSRNQDVVKRLNEMSQSNPEMTLSEAMVNISQDLDDAQIAIDTNGY